MHARDALEHFQRFAAQHGVTIERLTAAEEAAIIATFTWSKDDDIDPAYTFYQEARIAHLASPEAIGLMAAFYRDERADDCLLESHGDMLLFQWGTYDWGLGRGEAFEYNITRQLIPEPMEPDEPPGSIIGQLSLTLKFQPTEALRRIGSGNHWCERLADLDGFLAFIHGCQATARVADLAPRRIEVTFQNAE